MSFLALPMFLAAVPELTSSRVLEDPRAAPGLDEAARHMAVSRRGVSRAFRRATSTSWSARVRTLTQPSWGFGRARLRPVVTVQMFEGP